MRNIVKVTVDSLWWEDSQPKEPKRQVMRSFEWPLHFRTPHKGGSYQ